jgi:uncharacterized protein
MWRPDDDRGVRTVVLFLMTLSALLAFYCLFAFKKIGPLDFWWWFTANVCILGALVVFIDGGCIGDLLKDIRHKPWKKVICGLFSAGMLFAVFFAGNRIAPLIFRFAESGVREVYEIKTGTSLFKTIPLIVLILGPGEEFLWRGFFQKQYARKYGAITGFAASLCLYTLIHAGSRNFMLVISAIVAGSFWGWLYRRWNSLLLNIVSHVTWDLAVFVFFPFSDLYIR